MPSPYVLPCYVVCDSSVSMTEHIDAMNGSVRELCRTAGADPVVADRTRICVIGFSCTATVVLPLRRPREIIEVGGLTPAGATNFGAAFTLLRDTIERDTAALAAQDYRVHRPAVFFLSDGQPTDPVTWPAAHAALTDPSWPAHPNMIAFGVGDADPATIGRVGTFRSFVGREAVSPGAALCGFARCLLAGS
jgi:uncharacterized protein YegL